MSNMYNQNYDAVSTVTGITESINEELKVQEMNAEESALNENLEDFNVSNDEPE